MRKIIGCGLAFAILALPLEPANATPLKFKLINKSAEALSSFTLTIRGATPAANRLATALAAGAISSPPLNFDPGGTACVFDLTFTSASGKITNQPDTDLCQTEAIMVQ